MSQDRTHTPAPACARSSFVRRLPMLFVAVLLSSGLLGGVLGLFDMQSRDATLARAAEPGGKASSVIAASDRQDRPPVVARATL